MTKTKTGSAGREGRKGDGAANIETPSVHGTTSPSTERNAARASDAATGASEMGLEKLSVMSIAFALGWQLAEIDLSGEAMQAARQDAGARAGRHKGAGSPAAEPLTGDEMMAQLIRPGAHRAVSGPKGGSPIAPRPGSESESMIPPASAAKSERPIGLAPEQTSERPQLAPLRELALQRPIEVVLPQLNARLDRVRADFPDPDLPAADQLGAALRGEASNGTRELAQCIHALHQSLAGQLSAADGRLAAAYDLGRELAYATQAPDSSHASIGDLTRHDEISEPLADLSSAFPPHSSRAVQLSLAAWHEWLDDPPSEQAKGRRPQVSEHLHALRLDPARRPLWRATGESRSAGQDEISAYLKRQGQVWRAVLAGEKDVRSMMDTTNYEKAAHQLFRRAGRIVCRLTWTNKWAVALALALIGSAIAAVMAFNGTAKILTFGAAVIGIFGVSVKGASTAVQQLSTKIGQELWGAEVDVAAAQAITRLPNADQTKLRFERLSDLHRAPGPARGTPAP